MSFHHYDRPTDSLYQRRIVRGLGDEIGGGVCGGDHVPGEGLWCLGVPESTPVGRAEHPALVVHLLHGVHRGPSRHGPTALERFRDASVDDPARHERARAIVDDDDRYLGRERRQAGPYRVGPRRPTRHQADPGIYVPQPLGRIVHVVRSQRNDDDRNVGAVQESAYGKEKNGHAAEREEQLLDPAHPLAQPGRRDDDADRRRSRPPRATRVGHAPPNGSGEPPCEE